MLCHSNVLPFFRFISDVIEIVNGLQNFLVFVAVHVHAGQRARNKKLNFNLNLPEEENAVVEWRHGEAGKRNGSKWKIYEFFGYCFRVRWMHTAPPTRRHSARCSTEIWQWLCCWWRRRRRPPHSTVRIETNMLELLCTILILFRSISYSIYFALECMSLL